MTDEDITYLKPVAFFKPKSKEINFFIGIYIVAINLEKIAYKIVIDVLKNDEKYTNSKILHDIDDVYNMAAIEIAKFGDIQISILTFDGHTDPERESEILNQFLNE